jgi:hypothetical protein
MPDAIPRSPPSARVDRFCNENFGSCQASWRGAASRRSFLRRKLWLLPDKLAGGRIASNVSKTKTLAPARQAGGGPHRVDRFYS